MGAVDAAQARLALLVWRTLDCDLAGDCQQARLTRWRELGVRPAYRAEERQFLGDHGAHRDDGGAE